MAVRRREQNRSLFDDLEDNPALTPARQVDVLRKVLSARNHIGCCGPKDAIAKNFINVKQYSLRAPERFFAANPGHCRSGS